MVGGSPSFNSAERVSATVAYLTPTELYLFPTSMLQESVKRKERRQCPRSHPKAAPEPNLHDYYEFFSDRSQGGLITGAANPKIQRTGAEISRLSHKLLPAADLERWIDRIT